MTANLLPLEGRAARGARTESWRRAFIGRHGGRCHYCNRVGSLDCGPGGRPWHVDHKTPIALGGTDDEDNLALSCKRCNLAKSAKPYETFQALARVAFWQPDEDYASEADLDYLADLLDGCPDLLLSSEMSEVDFSTKPVPAVWGADLDLGTASEVLLQAAGYAHLDRRTKYLADLLVATHKLLPRLLAEIRMARADTAA